MKTDARTVIERTPSIWKATVELPSFTPLTENAAADACVIGSGISGLSTAYLLARAGRSVIIIDDGPLSGGVTQVTTAHLTDAIDDRFYEIERIHGKEGARLAAESHAAAIDRIESQVRDEGIACDFERLDGFLFLPPGEPVENLERELESARRAGVKGVAMVGRAPLTHFDTGPAIRFPAQAQFHPLKYLAGLVRAIVRDAGRIYTGTHADAVEGGKDAHVKANGHIIRAKTIVVATNTPINDRFVVHTKQAPYMTYAIGAVVPKGSVTRALYWDTADPYHYIRLQDVPGPVTGFGTDNRVELLIVGGEDHKTGQADNTTRRHERLEQWARERFPTMGAVEFAWSGQVMETIDGLAFIGRNPADDDNVMIVTGDSGQGMTHGTIAGMLLSDIILGRPNPWIDLYDPARKSVGAVGEFTREALNTAAQYTDWVTPGDTDSVSRIPPDCGAVLRRGLKKVAVYRDERSILHERSAVCPHLGCIVNWNPTEKSWDCPCHGSRFDKFGVVINGPANRNLDPVDPE